MPSAHLDRAVDMATLRKLYDGDVLNDDLHLAMISLLRPTAAWYTWARRMLLFLGSALLLSGIIFFFAYNWGKMGHFLKLGLIQFGIIACVGASHFLAKDKVTQKVLVLSASVLVGVLLAVYGQTYQTGADTFELFTGWAVLIVGWVLMSEFEALWLVWLILVNIGAILYWYQVALSNHAMRYESLCLLLAATNGLALVFRELGFLHGLEWIKGRWLRSILLLGSLVALSIPTIQLIVDIESAGTTTLSAGSTWFIGVVFVCLLYRYKFRDMIPLAIVTMNSCVIVLILIAKGLLETAGPDAEGAVLLLATITICIFSGAIYLLRKIAASMAAEVKGDAI